MAVTTSLYPATLHSGMDGSLSNASAPRLFLGDAGCPARTAGQLRKAFSRAGAFEPGKDAVNPQLTVLDPSKRIAPNGAQRHRHKRPERAARHAVSALGGTGIDGLGAAVPYDKFVEPTGLKGIHVDDAQQMGPARDERAPSGVRPRPIEVPAATGATLPAPR